MSIRIVTGGTLPVPELTVHRSTLSCGARLLVDEREGAPVTAMRIHLRGGHSLDPTGLEGVANLTGALLDQGTGSHTEEELAEKLEPVGGSVHGDSVGVFGTVASASWKVLAEVASELVLAPTFPEPKVLRQKQRVLERLLVERDDHRTQAAKLFRALVYGDHWLGRPSRGTLEGVERIGRDDLVAFHRENWCPDRALIAVSGDVRPAEVKRFLERRLKDWKPRAPLGPVDRTFPERGARSAAFRADRQQVHVFLGHLGVERSHPLFPAMVVMDHVLGTGPGFSNRVSQRLRDQDGLAYTVHADVTSSAGRLPGMFTAYIGTSPDHAERAVSAFLEEMRRIRDERVGADELELVRSYLLGAHALGFERASRRAGHMISAERFGLPDGHLEQLVRAFEAVTAEDVREAARASLFPDVPCLAIGGPLSADHVRSLLKRVSRSTGRTRRRRKR